MRVSLLLFLSISLQVASAADLSSSWNDLRAKREALTTFHQEFEISRTFKLSGHIQASKYSEAIDYARGRWRERSISGAGDRIKLFDGQDLYEFEDGNDEYVRIKHSSKEESPQPTLYVTTDLELRKAEERRRGPCGLPKPDHECMTVEIPVKGWVHNVAGGMSRMSGGDRMLVFDTATGLLIASRTIENIEEPRGAYQSDVTYMLKRLSYNGAVNDALFRLPPSADKEVKKLPFWDAGRMKKQLAGKAAPELVMTDMQGKTIKLSGLRGKTVLLDFWATWCGPCRADGPSLDKLYRKYGDRNLTIIGISVNEERSIVQKFIAEHPHSYPIALTTENEMPRPYQVGVFPTYMVIDSEGKLAFATEGEKGFSELRKLLKKAGLDTE